MRDQGDSCDCLTKLFTIPKSYLASEFLVANCIVENRDDYKEKYMLAGGALGEDISQIPMSSICRRFAHRWRGLRSDSGIPTLQTYLTNPDPTLQPNTILIDVISSSLLRVRLFATGLVSMGGIDLTGSNLLDFADSADTATEMWKTTHLITDHPCALLSTKLASTASGRHVSIQEISFPVLPFQGSPPCLVSGISLIKALDFRDTVFRVVSYTEARWIDIGYGIPDHVVDISAPIEE